MYLKEVVCSGRDYATQAVALDSGTRLSDCRIKIGHDTANVSGEVLNGERKAVAGELIVAIPEAMELRCEIHAIQ